MNLAPRVAAALTLCASLGTAACGNEGSSPNSRPSALTTTTSPEVATPQGTPSTSVDLPPPFQITHKWSIPPHKDLSPRIMDSELCKKNFWRDEEGKRQPPVQNNPLIIRIDGRCNTPYDDERVGLYYSPKQEGKAPVVLKNGDAVGVECYVPQNEGGQFIQDGRGPSSGSDVWLGVVTINGEAALVPEVNAGYADEVELKDQGILREC